MNITQSVRTFITDELRWEVSPEQLTPDHPLLEESVMDSLGPMQVVQFPGQDCGVEIDDEDLLPESFARFSAIAELVERKESSAGG